MRLNGSSPRATEAIKVVAFTLATECSSECRVRVTNPAAEFSDRHGRTCFNTGRQVTILLIDGMAVAIKGKRQQADAAAGGLGFQEMVQKRA
jgi:hypothetical protein